MTKPDAGCVICGATPKYRCPGCDRRTCKLECVNTHKEKFKCTGKRSLGAVTILEFDSQTLKRDYNLLDETSMSLDRTERILENILPKNEKPGKLLQRRNAVKDTAKRRRLDVWLAPPQFSVVKSNFSKVDPTTKALKWTVTWVFKKADVRLTEPLLSETTIVKEAVDRFFNNTWIKATKHLFSQTYFVEDELQPVSVFLELTTHDFLLMDLTTYAECLYASILSSTLPYLQRRIYFPSKKGLDGVDFGSMIV